MTDQFPSIEAPSIKGKIVCPRCSELATRVQRKLHDRVLSMFKPVKRYHCDFCDWNGTLVKSGSQGQ